MQNQQLITASKALKQNGYALLKHYLSAEELKICIDTADQLEKLPEQINGPMKYFEKHEISGKELLNRVENFADHFPLFKKLIIQNRLAKTLEIMTGENYSLFKEKINFKMAGANGFAPHQDAPAFTAFTTAEMLIIMLPLQETNRENGCLQVVSNFFQRSILPHENGKIPTNQLSDKTWQAIPMQAGDILIFSSYLIHQSEKNLSDSARRCYFLTYNSTSLGDLRQNYFAYKRNHFPPRIERNSNTDYKNWRGRLARDIY